MSQDIYDSCFNFESHFWISLTQKCQWACQYCDHPTIDNPVTVDADYLQWFISIILKYKNNYLNTEICIEGGEIGIVSDNLFDIIFNSNISDRYTVTTNGLFMDRNMHVKYKDKLNYILYHVTSELTESNLSVNMYNYENLLYHYTIVVHKNNIQLLEQFINYNPNCMFLFHFLQPRINDLNFMDKNDFQRIYDIIKDKPNVFNFLKVRVLLIIKFLEKRYMMFKLQKQCQQQMNKFMFNLPKRKINRCCVSMNSASVDITEDNIKKILSGINIFDDENDIEMCKNCISSNMWRDLYNLNNKELLEYFVKLK